MQSSEEPCPDLRSGIEHYWHPHPTEPFGLDESSTECRVPTATQDACIRSIERRAAILEGEDVVSREVTRWMRCMLSPITWADPTVLTNVARDHALTEARPTRIDMDRMVGADP